MEYILVVIGVILIGILWSISRTLGKIETILAVQIRNLDKLTGKGI